MKLSGNENKINSITKKYDSISIVILFASVILFWNSIVWTGRTLFFDLIYRYYYPFSSFLSYSIHAKQIPLWNPFLYSGMPFLANLQTAVFYPFTYIFVIFEYPLALKIYLILHVFMAGLFMFYLCRNFAMGYLGSIASAVVFMFNGFIVLHIGLISNLSSIVWLPLILLNFHKGITKNNITYLILTGIFLTLQFFGGHPQFFYWTLIILVMYFISERMSNMTFYQFLKRGAFVFTVVLVSWFCLAMAQILPSLELISNSIRGDGISFQNTVSYSIHPQEFIKFLVFPLWNKLKPFYAGDIHTFGFYFGVFALLTLLFNIVKLKSSKEKLFLVVLIVSFALAVGKYFPLYKIFYLYFPGWKYFRFPSQIIFVSAFSFSILTGFSIEKLNNTALKMILIPLIFVELYLFGVNANPLVDESFYKASTEKISFLKNDPDLFRYMLTPDARGEAPETSADKSEFWLNVKDMLYPNIGMAYNLFDADGHETMRLKRYDDFQSRITGPSSLLLDFLNVKYILSHKNITSPEYSLARDGYVKIYRNNNYLPRVFLVSEAKYLPENEILDYVSSEKFNPQKEVIVEEKVDFQTVNELTNSSGMNVVTIDSYQSNRLSLNLNLREPKWLVLSEVYYPGWKVLVDGKTEKVYRANYAFRTIPLIAGPHKVEFYYDPITFKIGAGVSLASFIIISIILICLNKGLLLKLFLKSDVL